MIRFKPCFVLARQIVICRKKCLYGLNVTRFAGHMWQRNGGACKVGTRKQYMDME